MHHARQTGSQRRGNPWRLAAWSTAACLLLLPLIAMQFTDAVDWDETDFIVFGAMLLAAGGALELGIRLHGQRAYRIGLGIAVVGAFMMTWMNLAVGIIGSEDNPANLMYAGVVAVGVVGALLARFEPRGMAWAMVATAVAQALVAMIALAVGLGHTFVFTAVFVTLWLTAGRLFANAAQQSRMRAKG